MLVKSLLTIVLLSACETVHLAGKEHLLKSIFSILIDHHSNQIYLI